MHKCENLETVKIRKYYLGVRMNYNGEINV